MFEVPKIVVGVGVGVVDDQMEQWDARAKRTKAFQNATDLSRAGEVVLGYGLEFFMPKYGKWGDWLATSAMPLLTKSVIKVIRTYTSGSNIPTKSFASRRAASVRDNITLPDFEGQRSY